MIKLRRNRMETLVEMMDFCRQPRKKTTIMYGCNLSHGALQEKLSFLLFKGFIKRDGDLYKTTKAGEAFCEGYRLLDAMLSFSTMVQVLT